MIVGLCFRIIRKRKEACEKRSSKRREEAANGDVSTRVSLNELEA